MPPTEAFPARRDPLPAFLRLPGLQAMQCAAQYAKKIILWDPPRPGGPRLSQRCLFAERSRSRGKSADVLPPVFGHLSLWGPLR